MLQDGIIKALEGITSLEEVQRVTGEGKFLEELYEKIITQLLLRSVPIRKEIADKSQNSRKRPFGIARTLEPSSSRKYFESGNCGGTEIRGW